MKRNEIIMELFFCLDERYACRERGEEVQRCCRELPLQGISVHICTDPKEDAAAKLPVCRRAEQKQQERQLQADGGSLYLADSAHTYQSCREKGLLVAGYLHAGNQQEPFPGAEYILMQPDEVSADSYCKIWQRLAGMPWTIAKTRRLVLREVSPNDYRALYSLYDAEANRFLTPLSGDREKEQEILRAYAENIYRFYGYGMWGIWEKTSAELIGRVGFAPPVNAEGVPELGYLVRKDCRRKGYAREAAEAALAFARDELGMAEVALQTNTANKASIALASALGFQITKKTEDSAEGEVLCWTKRLLGSRKDIMINEHYLEMLGHKSVIRELAEYAAARGKEVGYENVFDFSLGNPSVPAPKSFTDAAIKCLETLEPIQLHGYSPSLGIPEVKSKIAASLNRRFGMQYGPEHIFPTSGCAGAIAHALRVVTKPGDKVLVQAPFFPEYVPYINDTGAEIAIVPARFEDFQVNFRALEELLVPGVAAVLINSPNNPSGVSYSEETLKKLAVLLTEKSKELGYSLFLISDEPYREIAFDGEEIPYPARYYDNTLTCYSFSKSLSVPGERIGYVAVNPACDHANDIVPMCGQISRGIGHNCPSSLIQLAAAEAVDDTADLSVYEINRNLLYDCFVELGFEVQKPNGTFYIMPKALEEDAVAFCRKALQYDLVFVPCEGFHAPGYFRVAYCIDTEKVERSLAAIRRFVKEVYR